MAQKKKTNQKTKAKKLFNELPEDAQENFITHTKALGRVKSRIKQMGKSEGSEHNWYFY